MKVGPKGDPTIRLPVQATAAGINLVTFALQPLSESGGSCL